MSENFNFLVKIDDLVKGKMNNITNIHSLLKEIEINFIHDEKCNNIKMPENNNSTPSIDNNSASININGEEREYFVNLMDRYENIIPDDKNVDFYQGLTEENKDATLVKDTIKYFNSIRNDIKNLISTNLFC